MKHQQQGRGLIKIEVRTLSGVSQIFSISGQTKIRSLVEQIIHEHQGLKIPEQSEIEEAFIIHNGIKLDNQLSICDYTQLCDSKEIYLVHIVIKLKQQPIQQSTDRTLGYGQLVLNEHRFANFYITPEIEKIFRTDEYVIMLRKTQCSADHRSYSNLGITNYGSIYHINIHDSEIARHVLIVGKNQLYDDIIDLIKIGLILDNVSGLSDGLIRLVPKLDINQKFIKIDSSIKINELNAYQLNCSYNNIMTIYLLIDKMNQVYAKFQSFR